MAADNNSLNIIWLSVNRPHRAFQYYPLLLKYMKKQHNIHVVLREPEQYTLESNYIININNNINKLPDTQNINDLLHSSTYDCIITDALGVYPDINLHDINKPKIALINDVHNNKISKLRKKSLVLHKYNYLVYTYKYATQQQILTNLVYSHIKHSLWLPLAIDPTIFKNWNNKKTNNVLLSGRINKGHYPLRCELLKISKINSKLITTLPHYHNNFIDNKAQTPYRLQEYSKLLNTYIGAISTSSVYNYAVSKYFEIPASYTLLIGNLTSELEELGFNHSTMCVIYNNTNLNSQITTILNRKDISEITKNGFNMVHKYHTMQIRCERFTKFLNSL